MEKQRWVWFRVKEVFSKFCKPIFDVLNRNKFDADTISLFDQILERYSKSYWIDLVIDWILKTGDINYQHNWEWILHKIWVLYASESLFAKLLEIPWIDVNAFSSLGLTPLMKICHSWIDGNFRSLLLHRDLDLNLIQSSTWDSALSKTIWYTYIKKASVLYNDKRMNDSVRKQFLFKLLNLYNSFIVRKKMYRNKDILRGIENDLARVVSMMRPFKYWYSKLGIQVS